MPSQTPNYAPIRDNSKASNRHFVPTQLGSYGLPSRLLCTLFLVVMASLVTPITAYTVGTPAREYQHDIDGPTSGKTKVQLTTSTSSRVVKLLVSDGVLASSHYCMG